MSTSIARGLAPDLIHPVIGFRQWLIQWRDGAWRLVSLTSDEPWLEPELAARCPRGTHGADAAPASGCTCGVHAWYRPCPRTGAAGLDRVNGAVVLWGGVELHATGMRAKHARVVALARPLRRRKYDRVFAAAEVLGVPLVPHRDLAAAAREHGLPLPDALRPPAEWAQIGRGPIGVVPRLVSATVASLAARPAHNVSRECE